MWGFVYNTILLKDVCLRTIEGFETQDLSELDCPILLRKIITCPLCF